MRAPRREGSLPGFVSLSGAIAAAFVVAAVAAWTYFAGGGLFSPGALNAQATGRVLGGVRTHAALATQCEACHTAPWSRETMGMRCAGCHADVASQIATGKGLHARMAGTPSAPVCRGCHTEHHGPSGTLTFFDHDKVAFPLTGAHRNVACDLCHIRATTLADYRKAPRECFGCHAKSDRHKGAFGRTCGDCHNTTTWADAKFDHSVFPTDHGREERTPTCATCHPVDVSRYTCFGCHAHTTANVVGEHEGRSLGDLQDCIRCHRGGRREGGGD